MVEKQNYIKPDGSVYNGQMKKKENSQFLFISHGYGEQKFLDGTTYAGMWDNGICHGQGVLTFSNDTNYVGEFHNGQMNGEGTLYDKEDQILYKGSWKNNKKHGIGKEFNPVDQSNFDGTFLDGKKHGYGTLAWPDGSSYKGNWSHGMMSGQATLTVKKNGET